MGLDNNSRMNGIVNTISHIHENLKDMQQREVENYMDDDYNRIVGLIDNLWHAALKNERHSLHWSLGSESSRFIGDNPSSLWGVAISNQIHEEINTQDDPYTFNVFDHFLDIEGLVTHASKTLGFIYQTFKAMEQLIYYIRRYDDDFRKSFSDLDKLASDIGGACFEVFKSYNEFAQAYIVNQICQVIYGAKYPYKQDQVSEWADQVAIHHDLSLPMSPNSNYDLCDVMKIHIRLEASKKTQADRILAALALMGRRFNYEHQHKKLLGIVSSSSSLRKRKKEIERAIERCKKQKKEYDDEVYTKNDEDNSLSVYGVNYDPTELLEELSQK
jgi:hypothetical protein